MITDKRLEKCIPIALILAMVLSILIVPLVKNSPLYVVPGRKTAAEYEMHLFQKTKLMQIELSMDPDAWQAILDNPTKKEYQSCDIKVNGKWYPNVGIRAKGASSLDDVKLYFNGKRYSLMIKFDKFNEGQTCHGLDKLALNNCIYDKTSMKDAIAFDMSDYIGLAAPLCNYAKVQLNGKYLGCYMALEPVTGSFLRRNFGTSKGAVYEPYGALTYTGDDPALYKDVISEVKTGKASEQSLEGITEAIKSVHSGKDIHNGVDVDNILKYMAVQTMVVNNDGLNGSSAHNYYLYDDENCIRLLPWDYNMAFGGYPSTESNELPEDFGDTEGMTDEEFEAAWNKYWNSLSEEEKKKFEEENKPDNATEVNNYVNLPIDTPFYGDLSDRTFFLKLLENKTCLERYHKYLRMLSEGYIQRGRLDKTMLVINQEIGNIVGTEENAFYTNEQYHTAIQAFRKLLDFKAQAVKGQLEGKYPSNWGQQKANPDVKVDASSVSLEEIGTGN